ncbi:MAG: GTP-binding protein [Acidobacteria bacterium]|nr:GTP-binding protein [Acidobacteriota bacterium]
MIQKKICMLGATGVGKTSLVRQFVQTIFSEKYHSTIGVKIDKKILMVEDQEVSLMLWDVQGEDDAYTIRPSFLRGASGYLLVIDLTRQETLATALSIQEMVKREIGDMPFFVLLNKNDLADEIRIKETGIRSITEIEERIIRTSAKTGENVEKAFHLLANEMISDQTRLRV